MKPRYLILLIVCSFICFEMGSAHNDYYGFGNPVSQELESKYEYPEWYLAKRFRKGFRLRYQEALIGYVQAWNENMQKGIKRLNNQPQKIGVTPINGALLLNETDISVPGRHGGISATRFYNSKIWSADSESVAINYATLKPYSWMGTGWDLHFGRIWASGDSGKIFETSGGMHIYLKHKSGAEYISTDGSFMLLQDNTIKTGNGTRLIFDFEHDNVRYLTKTIDTNGNITDFFYNDNNNCLDSLKTSTNEKITFYSNVDSGYHSLDSISFKGFNDTDSKIIYHYDYDCWTTSSPFGSFGAATFLLKSVIYPNGDSVYYDYNDYFELTEVHTTGGGLVRYEYDTYNYYIPDVAGFPPNQNFDSAIKKYTRGIIKTKKYDQWTAPDTFEIEYKRIYTTFLNPHGQSNPDSVVVIAAEGNYQVLLYLHSGRKASGYGYHFYWYNGKLDETRYSNRYYDKNDVLLKQMLSDTKFITADSITVIDYSKVNDGAKTYETRYYEYDNYGNAHLIHECGDTAIATDDRWIHREYATSNDNYTFSLQTSAQLDEPPITSTTQFSSLQGVDTLIVMRQWGTSSGNWNGSKTEVDTIDYNPAYQGSEVLSLACSDNDTIARVDAIAKEYNSADSLHIYAIYDVKNGQFLQGNPSKTKNQYSDKRLIHLIMAEMISSDSADTDTLSMTHYFYDDTSYIVTTYSPTPDQWETPPDPPNIRGNLTRVEQWKGGSNHTKSELRYDQVGNVVMALSYPDANSPETTFVYYDPSDDADKYQYAYPWRTVTHLESGDSLCSRTEYDLHTGLVTRSIDESNSDSTRYEYDNMNRLKKIYFPNETSASKRITYKDDASPEAVIDSTYLDFTGEIDRWIVSKSFYDGFGRVIQTKNFDYDNTRTITQSISYNGNGLKDSVSNPYKISGTSMSYSSPNWRSLDITSYEYDGLNRIAKVIHPDAKNIMVKYYANTDTIYDEKGNKTIRIYNAYGALDTIINALNDTTSYQYDTLGRLTKVTDAKGKETKYYYDKLSRLKGVNGPDAKSSYFYDGDSVDVLYDEYDDIGNLKLKKDPNGLVKYSYDNINRLTKIELSTNGGTAWSDKVKFTYDSLVGVAPTYLRNPKGRLSRMITCGVDTIKYYYDDRGRLGIKRVNINGLTGEKTINYRFNYANLCTLINISPSYKTTYQYNRLGQLKSIPNLASTFKYNPAGQIVKLNYTNSVIDTITYDNRLRPTQIRVKKISDIMKLGYFYEDNSNVDSIADYVNNTLS